MYHKHVVVSLVLVVLVTACAAMEWRKEGVSRNGVETALSECNYQLGLNNVPTGERKQLVIECMQSKGFRWR